MLKSLRKRPVNKHNKKHIIILFHKLLKLVRSRKPSQIERNPSLDPITSCAPKAPLDRLMVPKGAKVGATSMPLDTFWAPKLTTSAPESSPEL